jgi:hypothetical protein
MMLDQGLTRLYHYPVTISRTQRKRLASVITDTGQIDSSSELMWPNQIFLSYTSHFKFLIKTQKCE